jgi:predicted alpha/beta-fold hydrolase
MIAKLKILLLVLVISAAFYKSLSYTKSPLWYINNKIIYHGVKSTKNINHQKIKNYYNKHDLDIISTDYFLDTEDGEKIHCLLLKNNTKNTIFLYSHGSMANIDKKLYSDKILTLLKNSSVLIYDYRGYGRSSGSTSENGTNLDIKAVWNSLSRMYQPNNIILYGRSIGVTVTLWLAQYLVKEKLELPKGIIVESGFSDLRKLFDSFVPMSRHLVCDKFNNLNYVKTIKDTIPIYLLHSPDDKLINISHAEDFVNTGYVKFCEISGTHLKPIYNDQVYDIINTLTNN